MTDAEFEQAIKDGYLKFQGTVYAIRPANKNDLARDVAGEKRELIEGLKEISSPQSRN